MPSLTLGDAVDAAMPSAISGDAVDGPVCASAISGLRIGNISDGIDVSFAHRRY
jgi:hypothetical protein